VCNEEAWTVQSLKVEIDQNTEPRRLRSQDQKYSSCSFFLYKGQLIEGRVKYAPHSGR